MISRILLICMFALISSISSALAGDLEDGIALIEKEEFGQAYKLLLPIAKSGDAEAQFRIGRMYMQNEVAVGKNGAALTFDQKKQIIMYRDNVLHKTQSDEASKWFKLAADQSHAEGSFYLSEIYLKQSKIEKNNERSDHFLELSNKLMKAAVKLGSIPAQYRLAEENFSSGQFVLLVRIGKLTVRDREGTLKSIGHMEEEWFKSSLNLRKKILTNGRSKILEYLSKKELRNMLYGIGQYYFHGIGAKKNLKEAFMWMSVPSKKVRYSFSDYKENFAHMRKVLSAEEIAEAEENATICRDSGYLKCH